jgi:hypothetical protein
MPHSGGSVLFGDQVFHAVAVVVEQLADPVERPATRHEPAVRVAELRGLVGVEVHAVAAVGRTHALLHHLGILLRSFRRSIPLPARVIDRNPDYRVSRVERGVSRHGSESADPVVVDHLVGDGEEIRE